MRHAKVSLVLAVVAVLPWSRAFAAEPKFRRHDINPESTFCACAAVDVNRDGRLDIVCGGWWYEAPDWKRHPLRDVPVIRGRYDDYSNLPLDVNGDGWIDLVSANYRSETLFWIENPGKRPGPWPVHVIAKPGPMETARLEDIDGDGQPDVLPNGMNFAAWWEVVRPTKTTDGTQAIGASVEDRAMGVPIDKRRTVPSLVKPGDSVTFIVPSPGGDTLPPASSEQDSTRANKDNGVPKPKTKPLATERLIGPFKVLSIHERLGSEEAVRAAKSAEKDETVITIIVRATKRENEEWRLEPEAKRLSRLLDETNNRPLTFMFHPRASEAEDSPADVATPNEGTAFRWVRHDLPSQAAGHGIGFGDINGDGRGDIVAADGWLEAPEDRRRGTWRWHPEFKLHPDASVPILVFDVDGDGDNDIVWGRGHNYGLFWLEQVRQQDGSRRWVQHEIDTTWAQAHSPLLADLDGDGRPELVVGKRYLGHDGRDPGELEPLCIYWYKFDRAAKTWQRHTISSGGRAGWGLDPKAVDLDGDGDIDLIAPGLSGLYWFENLTVGGG